MSKYRREFSKPAISLDFLSSLHFVARFRTKWKPTSSFDLHVHVHENFAHVLHQQNS
jgi:hypothetical protein